MSVLAVSPGWNKIKNLAVPSFCTGNTGCHVELERTESMGYAWAYLRVGPSALLREA